MKILKTFLLVISSALAQSSVTLEVRVKEYKKGADNTDTAVTGTDGDNVKFKFLKAGNIKVM